MGQPPDTTEHGFDSLYGLQIHERGDGRVRAEVKVHERMTQPQGRVHGGVYAALAESLAMLGTEVDRGAQAIPESSQITFLRPVTAGALHAAACALHCGRTTWVWEVEITDDQGELCALARMTVALRAQAGSSGPQNPRR
jgi:uncharacterized protein (TIGR00369 family)